RAMRPRRRTTTAAVTGGLLVAVAAVGVFATQLLDPSPAPVASPSQTPTSSAPDAPPSLPSTPVEAADDDSVQAPAMQPTPATTEPSSTTEPSATPPPNQTSAPVVTTERSVYYLTEGPAGSRLVRETRKVSAETPARGALQAMLRSPEDPDYFTPWP